EEEREKKGKGSGAKRAEADLNALRAARIKGYTNATFSSKDAVISAIMDERFPGFSFDFPRFSALPPLF
ncbi:hypothetical protein ACQ4LD_21735, partial [Sphingobacterium daejeonense]